MVARPPSTMHNSPLNRFTAVCCMVAKMRDDSFVEYAHGFIDLGFLGFDRFFNAFAAFSNSASTARGCKSSKAR